MYGMVNNAIRKMIVDQEGEDLWQKIAGAINLKEKSFETFIQYDDQITLDLVLAISKELNLEPYDLLESFGLYWINYAKESEYKSILTCFASNPVDLIESLDSLHSRLSITFENLNAPSFWVTLKNEHQILVHYSTKRKMPLEYFVKGLIRGIFHMFDQHCEIKILEPQDGERAIFQVDF